MKDGQNTARWFIENIKNDEIRKKCLENIDERCAEELCYSAGYALMLCVNQPSWERDFWGKAYWILTTEHPNYCDNSQYYKPAKA